MTAHEKVGGHRSEIRAAHDWESIRDDLYQLGRILGFAILAILLAVFVILGLLIIVYYGLELTTAQ